MKRSQFQKRGKRVKCHPNYKKNHIYLIDSKSHIELGYQSVTSFLEQFFEKFDAEKVIEKYYERWQENKHKIYFGMTKEEISTSWKNKGIRVREMGTIAHKIFEDVAEGNKPREKIEEINKFTYWYNQEVLKALKTEHIVYGEEELLIGAVDLIYLNNEGDVCIVDYKRSSIPDEDDYGRKCKLFNLPDTKKTKHTLQLSLYKYLLEKYYNVEIKHIYNLYIKGNNYEFIEQQAINVGRRLFD